jgi:hypothetical protein
VAYTENDVWALNCYEEARGEGVEGMRCVAWVTHNIAKSRNLSIEATVALKNEFSWTRTLGVNEDGSYAFIFPTTNLQFQQAQKLANDIALGVDKDDPTDGALYYANLDVVKAANVRAGLPEDAGWFMKHIVGDPVNHPETLQQGRHTFFK